MPVRKHTDYFFIVCALLILSIPGYIFYTHHHKASVVGITKLPLKAIQEGDDVSAEEATNDTSAQEEITSFSILLEVNKAREAKGLNPLHEITQLDASAAEKCDDMVKNNYYDHADSDSSKGYELIGKHLSAAIYASENLNMGNLYTNKAYIDSWLNSPAHRDTMLDPNYHLTGVAVCNIPAFPGQTAIVEHFAKVEDWVQAICGDGWASPSQGSGTCSHHDHVQTYIP